MNYGILQNQRRREGQEGAGLQALLADPRLRGVAQQMGLRPEDFGADAQQLWGALGRMAASDPRRYQEFIQEQLRDGPPSNQAEQQPSGAQEPAANARPRFFLPRAGFVVKAAAVHTVKYQRRETKLFLNCCAHEVVGAPRNPNNGKPVPDDTRAVPTTNSLEIPLVVGKPRELRDTNGEGVSLVVDVVFHDWVMRRCAWDANFKREILKLAIHWVQQDTKIQLVAPTGKLIKSRYKGGVAVGTDIITSKFYLDPKEGGNQSDTIASPSDLLKRMDANDAEEVKQEEKIVISAPSLTPVSTVRKTNVPDISQGSPKLSGPVELDLAKTAQAPPGKVLIEEIGSTSTLELPATNPSSCGKSSTKHSTKAPATKTGKNTEVVKRGFLNSSKATLYPKGSSEGHKASAYVNLLHRSKVVDMRDQDAQKQQQQQQEQQQREAEIRSMFGDSNKESPSSGDIDFGDYEFEQLCMEADPDLKVMAQRSGNRSAEDLLGANFNNLARFLHS